MYRTDPRDKNISLSLRRDALVYDFDEMIILQSGSYPLLISELFIHCGLRRVRTRRYFNVDFKP